MSNILRHIQATSIRSNILRAIATVSIAVTLLLSGAVFMAYEDLEEAMLTMIFSEEETFFLSHLDQQANYSLQTANLNALFIPAGSSRSVPEFFSGITPPFQKEVEHNNRVYFVKVSEAQDGILYLAKDITPFERQEKQFQYFLIAILFGALLTTLLLAFLVARIVIRPLTQLTHAIETLTPSSDAQQSAAFRQDYTQQELRTIAHAFARYLDEMNGFVQRERRLLGMASHELRTPVTVISGALDVIDRKGAGSDTALRALQRIRIATDEMREQLTAILTLARAKRNTLFAAVDLNALISALLDDATRLHLDVERIACSSSGPVILNTDSTLVKILLRNLIHNALQHTSGPINLHLDAHRLSIRDHGAGLPETYQQLLKGNTATQPPEGVIGLYLVALIAEHLHWRINIDDHAGNGMVITLQWANAIP